MSTRAKRSVVLALTVTLLTGFLLSASDPSAPAPVPCQGLLEVLPGLCSHGNDPRTTTSGSTAPTGSVVCDGDGVSGRRVQVLLGRASDVPTNWPSSLQVGDWASGVDGIFDASAQQTGGHRHVRYVTNSDCTLHVDTVTLPASADDDFAATISALQALGYNRADRKYAVLMDSSAYCGIATVPNDDRASLFNDANMKTGYARVDRPCWSAPVMAHELAHTIGAVQFSAPHATGGWHCTDEADLMCYQDSPSVTMSFPCPAENENRLDCGHDDYYSTSPSGWLAAHWNVANSGYLIGAPDPGPSPTPSPSRKCLIRLGRTLCL